MMPDKGRGGSVVGLSDGTLVFAMIPAGVWSELSGRDSDGDW